MKNAVGILEPAESFNGGSVLDFITLLKPRVMSLAVFTAACGFYLSPNSIHPFLAFTSILSIALGAGAAGCLNMWVERKTDALMSRTSSRPLPLGTIHPDSALAFGIILATLSIILLDLSAGHFSAGLLLFSIFYYVVFYTYYLKPRTVQNIVIGGAAGALPPVIGWSCTSSVLAFEPWVLFSIIFFWTPAHFWALSLPLKEEYQKAGIPIMPNVKGTRSTCFQIFIYSAATLFVSLSFLNKNNAFYSTSACILGTILIYKAYMLYEFPCLKKAKNFFFYTILYLFLIFLAVVIE